MEIFQHKEGAEVNESDTDGEAVPAAGSAENIGNLTRTTRMTQQGHRAKLDLQYPAKLADFRTNPKDFRRELFESVTIAQRHLPPEEVSHLLRNVSLRGETLALEAVQASGALQPDEILTSLNSFLLKNSLQQGLQSLESL